MLNCKDVTRLASKALDAELPWTTRLRVRFHILICRPCRVFKRQLDWIHTALENYSARPAPEPDSRDALGPDAKARLKERLHREKGG